MCVIDHVLCLSREGIQEQPGLAALRLFAFRDGGEGGHDSGRLRLGRVGDARQIFLRGIDLVVVPGDAVWPSLDWSRKFAVANAPPQGRPRPVHTGHDLLG